VQKSLYLGLAGGLDLSGENSGNQPINMEPVLRFGITGFTSRLYPFLRFLLEDKPEN